MQCGFNSIFTNIPNEAQSSVGKSSILLRNVDNVSVMATDTTSMSNLYQHVKESKLVTYTITTLEGHCFIELQIEIHPGYENRS